MVAQAATPLPEGVVQVAPPEGIGLGGAASGGFTPSPEMVSVAANGTVIRPDDVQVLLRVPLSTYV